MFKQFQALVERQTGKKLKSIRTDNEGEYSSPVDDYCRHQGYGLDEFGYILYDPVDKKLMRSRDVVFIEDQTIQDIEKTDREVFQCNDGSVNLDPVYLTDFLVQVEHVVQDDQQSPSDADAPLQNETLDQFPEPEIPTNVPLGRSIRDRRPSTRTTSFFSASQCSLPPRSHPVVVFIYSLFHASTVNFQITKTILFIFVYVLELNRERPVCWDGKQYHREDDEYLGDPLLPESSTNDHEAEDDGKAKDLGIGPRIWIESKKLWYIAGPAIFSRVVNFSMSVITQAFAGHLGEVELAALSIGLSVILGFSFGFLLGMASALETLCGQAFGAKRYHMLGIYLQRSWIVLFLSSILLLPIYIFAGPILKLLGQSDEVAEEAGVVALGLIPLQLGLVFMFPMQRFLQSQLKPFVIAWVSFAALLVNLLTTWLFIYVLDFGIVGAVVALDISWWVSVLALYGYVTCGGCPLSWTGFSLQAFSGLWEFIKLSVASGVMLCLESWYYTIVVLMTGYLKNATIAVDALSICTNINGWEMMIHLGFFAGAGVRVANELGAGNGKAARFATIVAVSYSAAIGLFFCILILILHDKVAYIFTSSAEVLQAVDKMSYLLGITILLNSVQPVLSGVAVGSGWQAFVAYINLGCYYIIGLPLGFLMGWAFDFGVMGIWGGMIFGTAIQTLILAIITIRSDWKKQAKDASKHVTKWSNPKPEPNDQHDVQH
ncbi:protein DETOXIFICATION 27-like [Juglans microcarpa x Juglans regia]|uniref:protein DETOXIFICATION 27-like n=1 Tax=Juglans microcarpa x Juglans regia TaxID=2249226 RepID=UPI001B7DD10A|nr:protein DETOXIFICATION 27-like [Juglans microcarpa x Juglans regia]